MPRPACRRRSAGRPWARRCSALPSRSRRAVRRRGNGGRADRLTRGEGRPSGGALRCGGGRVGLRRLGGGLPAGPGRAVGAGPGARPELPARFLPAQPSRAGPQPVGSVRRAVRNVRRMGVPRDRVRGVERAGRRFAHLRQRHAAQGPGLVRRRRARPSAPAVAGDLRGPGTALRGRGGHARSAALPLRRGAVLGHGQDPGDPLRGRGAWAWTGSCHRSRSASPAPVSPPLPASPSSRSTPTCTGSRAAPAGCAGSATSAATTGPRTRSTTPICPVPWTPGRRSAP